MKDHKLVERLLAWWKHHVPREFTKEVYRDITQLHTTFLLPNGIYGFLHFSSRPDEEPQSEIYLIDPTKTDPLIGYGDTGITPTGFVIYRDEYSSEDLEKYMREQMNAYIDRILAMTGEELGQFLAMVSRLPRG